MTATEILAEAVLRLTGVFYAVTAPLVLRAGAMSQVLNDALSALGAGTAAETRAERGRMRFLSANSVLIGSAGVFLAAGAAPAVPLFITATLIYAAYLFVVAPRWFDPYDPPEEPGRTQTHNALYVLAGATVLIVLGWAGGLLTPWAELPAAMQAGCVVLPAGLVGYALWVNRARRSSFAGAPMLAPDIEAEDAPPPVSKSAILTPSWSRFALVDSVTGNSCHGVVGLDLSQDDRDALDAWSELFRSLADPNDPERWRLLDPDSQVQLEEAGRILHARLVEKAGADRISYEPQPRLEQPEVYPDRLKVMADYHCDAVWFDSEAGMGPIASDALGISWALARDLDAWADEFDDSIDWDDPGGVPRWTDEDHDAHDRRGAALTQRLREELDRTRRTDVAVRFIPGRPAGASQG